MKIDTATRARFEAKYELNKATGCWDWTASCHNAGYGQLTIGPRPHGAHRVAYWIHVGEIPEGLEIDHLCRNRRCVNPEHLEAVTRLENVRRGDAGKKNREKTTCKAGHQLSEANTYNYPDGRRDCRVCRDRYRNEWRVRHGVS